MIEDDESRLAFLDEDEFAEKVAVAPDAGEQFDVIAIFDANPVPTSNHDNRFAYKEGARPSGSAPRFRCLASAFPKSLSGRAVVTVRDKAYTPFDVQHDGTGWAYVTLKVA